MMFFLALCVSFLVSLTGCGSKTTDTVTVVQPNAGGSIQGVIKDASTQEPIAGAVVDIGGTRVTTTNAGQFSFPSLPVATYSATLDMTNVTSPVAMANTAATPRYSKYSFQTLTAYNTGSASSVPATESVVILVGKLDATISGTVTDNNGVLVGSGYNVSLSNTATPATIVSTTTTASNGSFSFVNIEAMKPFTLSAKDAAGLLSASAVAVTAPNDGGTVNQTVKITASTVAASAGVTPEHNSDIAPVANQNVVFTFSKPIKQTAVVADTSNSNPLGLYSYVAVNFTGNKAIRASNIAHTLAWSADRTQLTVTLPVVAVSATYRVDLCNAPLTDDSGTVVAGLSATACNASGVGAGTAGIGYVVFTTNGGATAAAPTISNTNSASLNAATATVPVAVQPSFDWLPVSGAKAYNIYRSMKQVWGATSNTHPATKLNAAPWTASSYTDTGVTYVENNAVKLTYDYTVTSLNSDSIESAPSVAVTAADVIKPMLLQAGSSATATTITLVFNELVDAGTALNAANYTVTAGAAVPVASVTEMTAGLSYRLNFAVGAVNVSSATVAVAGVTDVAGNLVDVAADTIIFAGGAAGAPN